MSSIGKTVIVKGEVRSTGDITIEGRVEGPLFCEDNAVVLAATAQMVGDVIARDITIHGTSTGQLIATEVVDVRAEARVTGTVMAKRFILNERGQFNGRVEPQHLEAALRVAKYEQKKREAGGQEPAKADASAKAPESAKAEAAKGDAAKLEAAKAAEASAAKPPSAVSIPAAPQPVKR